MQCMHTYTAHACIDTHTHPAGPINFHSENVTSASTWKALVHLSPPLVGLLYCSVHLGLPFGFSGCFLLAFLPQAQAHGGEGLSAQASHEPMAHSASLPGALLPQPSQCLACCPWQQGKRFGTFPGNCHQGKSNLFFIISLNVPPVFCA